MGLRDWLSSGMIPAMNASVPIQVRVPHAQAKVLKRAAKQAGKKLATYVRDAAVWQAIQYTTATTAEEVALREALNVRQDSPALKRIVLDTSPNK